jgi:hypothetical protein
MCSFATTQNGVFSISWFTVHGISLSLSFLLVPLWSMGHPWNALFHFSFLITTQSVGLLGWRTSSSQSCYLHRTTQTQNRCWVGFEPTIPVFEQAKTVHVLDRAATVIGCTRNTFLLLLLLCNLCSHTPSLQQAITLLSFLLQHVIYSTSLCSRHISYYCKILIKASVYLSTT